MLRPIDYSLNELKFAYVCHVYLHWQAYRRRASTALSGLQRETVEASASRYSIHVLECRTDSRGVRLLVSLRPEDAVAAAGGKLKGQAAKWLRQQSGERRAPRIFRLHRREKHCLAG